MGKEIERKFRVDPEWAGQLTGGTYISQGYLPTRTLTTVRARVRGDQGFLTIKGANRGATRTEYEYAIPVADAREIIADLCEGKTISKTRYEVTFAGYLWEVDIFEQDNKGLIIAEVELTSEQEQPEWPPWVLQEVTGDTRYYNSNLIDHPFNEWSDASPT